MSAKKFHHIDEIRRTLRMAEIMLSKGDYKEMQSLMNKAVRMGKELLPRKKVDEQQSLM